MVLAAVHTGRHLTKTAGTRVRGGRASATAIGALTAFGQEAADAMRTGFGLSGLFRVNGRQSPNLTVRQPSGLKTPSVERAYVSRVSAWKGGKAWINREQRRDAPITTLRAVVGICMNRYGRIHPGREVHVKLWL